MAFDPGADTWITPCDLCGSVKAERLRVPHARLARKCKECGLITLEENGRSTHDAEPKTGKVKLRFPGLRSTLLKAAKAGAESVLIIGDAWQPVAAIVRRAGLEVTVVSSRTAPVLEGIIQHSVPLEQAPFLPDQFDIIIATDTVESLPSPALFFEKTRLWLVSGGILMVGGANGGSMGARLAKARWMSSYGSNSRYVVSLHVMKRYADRFGFDVRTATTYARPEPVTGFLDAVLAPFSAISGLLGLGELYFMELEKRGVAVRALMSRATEERESAPGLAPALYTGFKRELATHDWVLEKSDLLAESK